MSSRLGFVTIYGPHGLSHSMCPCCLILRVSVTGFTWRPVFPCRMAIKPGPTGFVALEHRPRAHRPKCDYERLDRYIMEVASEHHRAARVVSLRTARTRKRRSRAHAVCVVQYFKLQQNLNIDPFDCFSVCKRVEPLLGSVRFRLRSGPLDFRFPLEGSRTEAIEHA